MACLLHHIFLGDTTRALHFLFLVSQRNTHLRVVSVTRHGVSLGYLSLARDASQGRRDIPRTAVENCHGEPQSHLGDEAEEPPHILSSHLPSRLPSLSPLGSFSLFLSQSNLDIYRSKFIPLFNRRPSTVNPTISSWYPSHGYPSRTQTQGAILGPKTVLGPKFPYLLILLLPSHPLLLAQQRQHIVSIHPANTKKLVHAELFFSSSTLSQHTK